MKRAASVFARTFATAAARVIEPGHHILKTVKPETSRKTYLVDRYAHLLRSNPVLVFVQHNNISATEAYNLRRKLDSASQGQAKLRIVRNNLFKVALRGLNHADPASRAAHRKYAKKTTNNRNPIDKLLIGPTAAIAIPSIDMDVMKKVMEIVNQSQDRLVVLGARIDSRLLDIASMNQVKELGSLEMARARLCHLLASVGGGHLVNTIQSPGQYLLTKLAQHKDNIK